MLFYKYKGKCVHCWSQQYFYLLEPEIVAGDVICNCGYNGLIDLIYISREWKEIKQSPILNKDKFKDF